MLLRKSSLSNIAFILFLIYAFFSDMINSIFSSTSYRYVFWGITLILMAVSVVSNGKFVRKKKILLLTILVFYFVLFRNQAFANGGYVTTVRWLYFFLFMLLSMDSIQAFNNVVRYIANIGFINVIATYFFWLVPRAYSMMYSFWGYWPSGTSYGRLGYKAALTNHYSHNGIVLAVTYLAIFAIILSQNELLKRKSIIKYKLMMGLTMFAVILITKRAHLLFGIIAMVIVYYLCNPHKMKSRTFKIIIGGIIAVVAVYIMSFFVPEINQLLSRFSSIDDDKTMQSRFSFWMLAFNMFLRKPLWGYGWFGFRYQYAASLYDTTIRSARYELLDCHNVYLQVLAELGVIGFLLYIIVIGSLLWSTFFLLRRKHKIYEEKNLDIALLFSAAMQVFYLLYSFTGNCLYDITFAFYCIAAAFTLGSKYYIDKNDKRKKNESPRKSS